MVAATHDREIFSLVVRNELKDEVKTVADLKGKKVGFSTPGAGSWAFASAYLQKAGLNPETDLEFVSLGGDAGVIYSALETGKVDAMASWEPTRKEKPRTKPDGRRPERFAPTASPSVRRDAPPPRGCAHPAS